MLFPEARSEHIKEKILQSDFFAEELRKLEEKRKLYLRTPLPELPFQEYERFFRDGNRLSFETLYFARRERLSRLTLAVLLYGRKEDLSALEDLLWAICGEHSWVLPAHARDLGEEYDKSVIDLFSAETGFALSEIRDLLGEKLSPKVRKRIMDCLEERILEPYCHHTYFWEEADHNWAAVCGGSVGAVFLYAAPERFPQVKKRVLHTMERYLSGFGEDGICLEGLDYWNYGFGFFTIFAQLLSEFTQGEENLLEHPLCSRIAAFQEHAFLKDNCVVSFSDSSRTGSFQPGLTYRLHERYRTALLPREHASFLDNCFRIQPYLRNFFWTNPEEWAKEGAPENECQTVTPNVSLPQGILSPQREEASRDREFYFPQAQWYIAHRGPYSLAAKAGHNDEPHNHNDVGSFLLLAGEETVLCDFGAGEYTSGYFRPESRYDSLCASSLGHSLPIIHGKGQCPGRKYCGRVLTACLSSGTRSPIARDSEFSNSAISDSVLSNYAISDSAAQGFNALKFVEPGKFCIEIAGAYEDPGLLSALRCLELTDEGLLLTDRFQFSAERNREEKNPVTERFVTLLKPRLEDGRLLIGSCCLEWKAAGEPAISAHVIAEHDGRPATLYCIDFVWDAQAPFQLKIFRGNS